MRLFVGIFLGMFIFGCSSVPASINYYLLDSVPSAAQPILQKAKLPVVVLEPILLADYLQQSSLVMQSKSHQLHYSSQDIWAQDLDMSIASALLSDLNIATDDYQFTGASEPFSKTKHFKLVVKVEHFLPTGEASVILSGEYWLLSANDDMVITNQAYQFEKKLDKDGFQGAVTQMRGLVSQLASSIKRDLKALSARP